LLAGDALPSEGGRFAIRFATKPGPPVYLVATSLRLLELAGRVADGVVLNVGRHPAVLRAARARIAAGAVAARRDPAAVETIAFFFCAIADDGATARARLAPSVSWFAQRFPGLCELAAVPLDPQARAGLARFESDYARYDLVHADQWAQAVQDAAFLPPAFVDAFALGGTPAEVTAQIREVQALGFDQVSIRPPSSEDWRPTVRALIREVIPALQ
jgi:5,10-methylenetetrahydromethanopterin reductase